LDKFYNQDLKTIGDGQLKLS
jgi:hypothetical protein